MRNHLVLVLLLSVSAACGDEETGGGGGAAASTDSGLDAVADAAVEVIVGKVRSAGAACSVKSPCEGERAQCLSDIAFPGGAFMLAFEGGYCSAQCTSDVECRAAGQDEGGACPFGMLAASQNPLLDSVRSNIEPLSICLQTCEREADCRGGDYRCATAAEAIGAVLPAELRPLAAVAGGLLPQSKYCLPRDISIPALDAGMPDAGTLDAGMPDAALSAQ
ncbi:MAG: hypothetical protein RL385_3914 [Pseudomonadota bacterium]